MKHTIHTAMTSHLLSLASVVVAFVASFLGCARAEILCNSNTFCQDLYNSTTTVCLTNTGTCSNPFQQGCLKAKLLDGQVKDLVPRRICNSDDNRASDADSISSRIPCIPSAFEIYPELRIHNGNWESSVILSWVYQILLMEVARVPATVGLTTNTTSLASFYSLENRFEYSEIAYPYQALATATQVHDCASTKEPCVHILPEVWMGQEFEYAPLVQGQTIEPTTGNGLLGRSGLYIPVFTAKRLPRFGIWYGLTGEANRRLLAESFHRPVAWLDYCNQISPIGCQEDNPTASRFPGPGEEDLYYSEGIYMGHFRPTEANNCTLNPTTCTGHIVTPPCSWSSTIDAQLFWNDIVGLKRDGPLEPVGGYTQAQMIQVWKAANATKSHVIMHWYEPEPLHVEFLGTEYEFTHVTFPVPTDECLENRVDTDGRCSENVDERRGEKAGRCGDDIQVLQRLIVSTVGERNDEMLEVDQSPAYELIKNMKISNMDMNAILRLWKSKDRDPFGNDAREAVCEWVIENLDQLLNNVPFGHPRTKSAQSGYKVWYLYTAQAFAGLVAFLALLGVLAVHRYRNTKTMVFAQPIFMNLILLGFLLVSLGAILYAATPTTANCVASAWLLLLGYTVELVPVLVKTSKINQLIRSSRKQKRINISRRTMLVEVAFIISLVLAFLISWTVLDPPEANEIRILGGEDGSVVAFDVKCASKRDFWRIASFGWQALLLVLAAFLAFQSRDVMAQLNESKSLAMMVYSHFLFVCLRGVYFIFYIQDTLASNVTALMFTLTYALDALTAMGIYVFPKVLAAHKAPGAYRPGLFSASTNNSTNTPPSELASGEDQEEPSRELSILICSANMGNTEPTKESLETWIPPGGACDRVTPLEDCTMTIPSSYGTFDVVVIGMQEATWTEETPRASNVRREVISEDEVLAALEEKNTAQLREMMQDVLGENYYQVVDERRGQMRLHVWVRRQIARHIKEVKIRGTNTGIGNVLANKGGIVATIDYKKTRLSFVSCHLAAHEGESYYKTRCDSVRAILKDAKTFELSTKFDVATSSHHSFFLGDLNFRTRLAEKPDHAENVRMAMDLIEFKDYTSLYAFDELQEGLTMGDLLVGYTTLPCDFPPTFKVEPRQLGFHYKEQRMPSWTDRILYKSSSGLGNHLKPFSYEACGDFITSDHKPIRGAFSLVPNEDISPLLVQGETLLEFQRLHCSNLSASTTPTTTTTTTGGSSSGSGSKLLDPYLMIMWDDSVDLHSEPLVPVHFFRKIWSGHSWPQTEVIAQTSSPHWKGDSLSLGLHDKMSVGAGAMLFVTVLNAGRDELLGATVLNVKELAEMNNNYHHHNHHHNHHNNCHDGAASQSPQTEKLMLFDRTLQRDGKVTGYIKFEVKVRRQLNNNGEITTGTHHHGGGRWRRRSSLGQFTRSTRSKFLESARDLSTEI